MIKIGLIQLLGTIVFGQELSTCITQVNPTYGGLPGIGTTFSDYKQIYSLEDN